MSVAGIEFDPAAHRYRVAGQFVPSVSTILKAALTFAGVPEDVLELALQRGTAVHRAVELDVLGTLDEATVDPRVAPYLAQWRKFCRDSGWQPIAPEVRCASARYGYAGTLDQVGRLPRTPGRTALLDLKTSATAPITVGPQTAGYEQAVRETYPNESWAYGPIDRYALLLTRDTYRLVPLTNPADIAVFTSALTLWRWCRDHNLARDD